MLTNLSIAFMLGLFSSIHCLGMCGGIMAAFSMGLPESIQNNRLASVIIISGYNLGRISSYTVAGILAGSAGYLLIEITGGHHILQICAGVILVILGLHIGGWLPRLSILESFGLKAWRIIQPLGKRFIPVNSFPRAMMIGMVWGWLPCGLVYSVLLWAAAGADPVTGALIMLCFGLGTLPAMIASGMAAGILQTWLSRKTIRKAFAITIILFGLAFPWLHFTMHGSTGNEPTPSVHDHN